MVNLTPPAYARLSEIARATQQQGSYYSLNDGILVELLQMALVVTNPQLVQRDNNTGAIVSIAARATDDGIAAYLAGPSQATVGVTPVAANWGNPAGQDSVSAPVFEIDSYDELPEIARTRQGSGLRPRPEVFPWTATQVGQRFFIPQTISTTGKSAGKPVAHYSAAASANARIRELYETAVAEGKPLPVAKHFIIVSVKAGDVMNKGTPREVIVRDSGEYAYCLAGLAEVKSRGVKADPAA